MFITLYMFLVIGFPYLYFQILSSSLPSPCCSSAGKKKTQLISETLTFDLSFTASHRSRRLRSSVRGSDVVIICMKTVYNAGLQFGLYKIRGRMRMQEDIAYFIKSGMEQRIWSQNVFPHFISTGNVCSFIFLKIQIFLLLFSNKKQDEGKTAKRCSL